MNVYALSKSPTVGDLPAFMQLLEQRPSTAYAIAAPTTPEPVRRDVLTESARGKKVTPADVRDKKAVATGQRKAVAFDGDRPPEPKRQEPPKREPVEGVAYRLVEDQYGYKHREPITAEPAMSKRFARISSAVETLVRAIVERP